MLSPARWLRRKRRVCLSSATNSFSRTQGTVPCVGPKPKRDGTAGFQAEEHIELSLVSRVVPCVPCVLMLDERMRFELMPLGFLLDSLLGKGGPKRGFSYKTIVQCGQSAAVGTIFASISRTFIVPVPMLLEKHQFITIVIRG